MAKKDEQNGGTEDLVPGTTHAALSPPVDTGAAPPADASGTPDDTSAVLLPSADEGVPKKVVLGRDATYFVNIPPHDIHVTRQYYMGQTFNDPETIKELIANGAVFSEEEY